MILTVLAYGRRPCFITLALITERYKQKSYERFHIIISVTRCHLRYAITSKRRPNVVNIFHKINDFQFKTHYNNYSTCLKIS